MPPPDLKLCVPLTTRTREVIATNYARHVGHEKIDSIGRSRFTGTGEYVFFGADSPWFEDAPDWAFYKVPEDVDPTKFTGKLIGR